MFSSVLLSLSSILGPGVKTQVTRPLVILQHSPYHDKEKMHTTRTTDVPVGNELTCYGTHTPFTGTNNDS